MVRLAVLPDLAPGENVRRGASGAAWSYLLADRSPRTALCLGVPTAATRATLDGLGMEIHVVPFGGRAEGLADGSVGLLAGLDPRWAGRLSDDGATAEAIDALLASDASRFIRLGRGPFVPLVGRGDRASEGAAEESGPGLLWLGLRDGEIRAVAPADDDTLVAFARAGLRGERPGGSGLRRFARRLLRRDSQVTEEVGFLRGPADPALPAGRTGVEAPPAYLRASAAAAGVAIDDRRWALVDPGVYATKKVLLYLFRPGETTPGIVVKLVRDRRFNARLEGAWAGLSALRNLPAVLGEIGPRPVFFGVHAGLAHLAESVVAGDMLRARLSEAAHDPLIAATADRLVRLEIATADVTASGPAEIAAGVRAMIERFDTIYRATAVERTALHAAADRIAASTRPFPLVLQHGDAGTWNVLIRPSGAPTLIDWEASVPAGMPLWDLFYFLRSAGVGVARRAGVRDALTAVEQQLLSETPVSLLLAESTRRVVDGTGLDPGLVEPLFQLCWMHRALKESSTLRPDGLDKGHYRRLLDLAIEQRTAPGLRRLVGRAGEDQ